MVCCWQTRTSIPVRPELFRVGVDEHLEHAVDTGIHMLGFEGFDNEVVSTCFKPFDHINGVEQLGDKNNRNGSQRSIGTDPAAEFITIHFRHNNIG